MASPEVGEIVTLSEVDSQPALFVIGVEEHLTGVLLADLARETIQRLKQTIGDREGRRELAKAVANAEDIATFAVPPSDITHRNGRGIQDSPPITGGTE